MLITPVLDKDGLIWGWGNNIGGNLGDNSANNKSTPVSIHGNKKTFCYIATGAVHVFGIDNYNKLWSWGDSSYGVLGRLTTYTPIMILYI